MATIGLTPYITPAMLLSNSFGISWNTFPKPNSSIADQIAAQLDVCQTVTSEMDTLANQSLRGTVDTEIEFGPDYTVTILPNGWCRFRLSHWPIITLTAAAVSPAGAAPPQWTAIPATQLQTEHQGLALYGTIVPDGAGPGPTAALIPPGYVDWSNGRKGYNVSVTSLNGFPLCGIDVAVAAGATSLHVDDITGWFVSGLGGARGTIYDPPYREQVSVTNATPDTAGLTSGPGTLTLSQGLQFAHNPQVGLTGQADQRILLSAMPQALLQAGFYLATHYGLIRGATAATVQTARGSFQSGGIKGAMEWYGRAEEIIKRYGRVF